MLLIYGGFRVFHLHFVHFLHCRTKADLKGDRWGKHVEGGGHFKWQLWGRTKMGSPHYVHGTLNMKKSTALGLKHLW